MIELKLEKNLVDLIIIDNINYYLSKNINNAREGEKNKDKMERTKFRDDVNML